MNAAALAGMIAAGIPLKLALAKNRDSAHWLIDLALSVGAPLVPALRSLDQQFRSQQRINSEVLQAQAIPRATRKLLLWLPLVAVVLGELMGLETISGLLTQLGLVALLLALLLLWVGVKLSGRMLGRLREIDKSTSEDLIALDLCIAAGVGLHQIETSIGRPLCQIASALIELSQTTGASLRPLIASEIERLNQEQLDQRLTDAKRLSVALLIPLSLTTLPAFLLLTIPPMLIGITQ